MPFRNERTCLENEIAEEAFNHLLPSSCDCSDYHDKLQKILQPHSNMKQINDASQAADNERRKVSSEDGNDHGDDADDDIQLIGKAKTTMQEVLDMNVKERESHPAQCPSKACL